jgi:hypothetical protein
LRFNYVFLHQKILDIYLNYKRKYNRVRFLIKPLQLYFRDFFRYGLDLRQINNITRNELNLVNSQLYGRFVEKINVSNAKKIILNSRIYYKKNIKYTIPNIDNGVGLVKIIYNSLLKPIYSELFKGTVGLFQLKKLLK